MRKLRHFYIFLLDSADSAKSAKKYMKFFLWIGLRQNVSRIPADFPFNELGQQGSLHKKYTDFDR